jgi:ABC-type antimicrobial peptide transport system permease subunit
VNVGIVGTVDYFPTADTFNEMFLLTDYDSLQRYGNLDATSSELTPNEIWISTTADPVQRAALVELLSSDVPFTHREVIDRVEVLAASQVDPLVAAGWRSLLFIAFGAVLTLSCLGFLVHAYVSFRNREMEFALMRTIGFSLRQLTTLVWLEQVLVIAAGLGLGTWMGGRLGEIIIPFLAHDDRGSQVLPPFVLEVNWVTLGLTYGVMVVVFALIIAVMITFIRRISLQRVLRLGEM